MNIRQRISVFSALIVGVIAVFQIVFFNLIGQQNQERVADAVVMGNQLIWDQLVHDQLFELEALKAQIENEFDLRSAIKRAEINEVREFAGRYFQLTGDSGHFDSLLVYGKDKSIFYQSGEQPPIPALPGYLDRAAEKAASLTDLVTDVDGRLLAMSVIPVKSRRGLHGFAVYLKEPGDVVTRLSERSGNAIGILKQSNSLQHDTGLIGAERAVIDEHGVETGLATWEDDGRLYQVSRQPIRNAGGETLGSLVVASDATDQLTQVRNFELGAYAALGVVLLIALFANATIAKHYIVKPARVLRDHLRYLANGDFQHRLERGRANDEFAEITESVNMVSQRLSDVLTDLHSVAHELVTASNDMEENSVTNLSLLQSQQGEAVQASSAMTEMSQTIEEIARNASQTASQAQSADQQANQGNQLVADVVKAMRQLSGKVEESSDAVRAVEAESAQIDSVLEVIQSIAEQTNLLALNAAIEAARAGEQGRGFAVVADEVRTLANRTQMSTTDIKDKIERLQQGTHSAVEAMEAGRNQTEDTVKLAESAGEALMGINASVASISDASVQIASASEEQSAVTNEAQCNVATIRDLAEDIVKKGQSVQVSSQAVHALAGRLQEIAGHFRV
jgi:methyl-accepting chemotaxis protein